MAINVYNDSYYNDIKNKLINEKKNIIEIFKKHKIDFLPSDTYFFLIQVNKTKKQIEAELEEHNIILYKSNDYYNNYWTLPLSTNNINNKIIDILIYSNL